MASPAASAGDLAIPMAQDPWDWTVEDVVTTLTSPDGLLRQLNPQYSSDPTSLIQFIREQSIWGSVLLRYVDDAFLEQKMGLTAVGPRCAVLDTIAELQDQSTKYQNYQMKQAARAAASNYGPLSNFGENRSMHQLQSNNFTYPMNPPLRRYLAEPLQSPDTRSIQVSQLGSSFGDTTKGVAERWRQSQCQENGGYDHSNNDSLQPEEAQAASRIIVSNRKVSDKNTVETHKATHVQYQEQSMAEQTHRNQLLQDEEGPDRDHGELYVLESTDNKRRKLDLLEQSEPNDNTEASIHGLEEILSGRMLGDKNSRVVPMAPLLNESAMPPADDDFKSLDDFAVMEEGSSIIQKEIPDLLKDTTDLPFDNLPSYAGRNTATPSIPTHISAETDPIGDDSIATMPHFAADHKEPGKIEIDAQGRKRMRPILITQSANEEGQEDGSISSIMSLRGEDEIMSVSNGGLEECPANTVKLDANLKSARRRYSNVYLGVDALPVDKIFYGDTAIGSAVSYDEPKDTIFPLESEEAANGRDSWFLSNHHSFGSGAQLYVSNRLKFFLSQPGPILLDRRSEISYGIIPYPARVVQSVRRHQPLSLTLMSGTGPRFITKRVNRAAWVKSQSPHSHSATNFSDDLGNDSLLSHLGENEIHDWDFLEKWRHRANGDDVLPLYGDSGSDGELDLDTWQEIEKEEAKQGRRLERPVGVSKHKHLSNDEVSDAIQRAMDRLVTDWKVKKLPMLDGKAWRLWTRSRRDKSKRAQIERCASEIARLEQYLQRIRDKIILERWSKVEKVMKQCQSAQLTVFDREFEKWKIGILELRSPPHKRVQAEKLPKVRKHRSIPESLQEDEEDLETDNSDGTESSSSGLDDFIVDEGDESEDERLMRDSLHEAQSPDEDIDMTSQDVTPLDVNEESHDVSTPSELRKEYRYSSSAVNTPSPNSVLLVGNVKSRDISSDDDNLLSSSPVLLDIAPGETHLHEAIATRGLVNKLIAPPDYIDLTQLSDSSEPLLPQIKEEQYRIRTPPLDNRNPFRRARRAAPPVFRTPPTPSNVINIESDDTVMTDNAYITDKPPVTPKTRKSLLSSPSKEMLPALQDIEGIASLDCALLVERQDRKRLLTWIIAHTPAATREETLAATSISSSVDIQWDIWMALSAIKRQATSLRQPEDGSEAFMQIAAWYVSWHMCRVYSERHGIPQSHVKETIDSEAGFGEFYNFIVERLDTIKLNADKRKEERRNGQAKSGLMSSGSKSLSQKRQKRIDDEPDSFNRTLHKKRKYAVPESQAALQMRDYNQQRFQERLKRQAQLQSQFTKMGATSENPLTMIVNGKADEEMIVINKDIGTRIQPHQLEGIQFMWSEIVTNDQEQGCLLAHSMGLGKTMQVITLLVTIAEASQHTNEIVSNQVPEDLRKTRALILCPPSLVDNWYDEVLMWMPGAASTILGDIHKISAAITPSQRLAEIQKWADNGGVLLVGYNMFKNLVHNKPRGKTESKKQSLTDEEHERARSQLLKLPTVIVADEAHTIKTRNSDISKAVQGFASKRRIALTGSPLANNLMEYYTIIDWIAPGYLGSRAEFSYKYVEPISDGLFADATQYHKRKGLKMLQVLKAELAPKVHRADVGILKGRLKGKTEFVLRVPLTQLQHDSYKLYVDYMLTAIKSKEPGSARLWAWLAILRLLCNHPLCFKHKLMEEPKKQKIKKNMVKLTKPRELESQTETAVALEEDIDELLEDSVENVGLPKAMIDEQIARLAQESIPIDSIAFAHKMQLLLQIIELSIAVHDKVLVFSHNLDTLDYVGNLLRKNSYAYERLDGKTNMSSRQQLTKDFNQVKSVNVCLISTRAGGQGLNLFGANRVIIMDDTFNPMYEEQAIGRAYRIGQLKHVFVYRLTVGGTFEQALQDQSLFKLQLATRVVDKKNPMRHALKGAREYLFEPKAVEQKDLREFVGKDVNVLDKILASEDDTCIIRSIDLSETFQQEVDEPLTVEELKEAEQMVKDEQLRRTNPAAYELVKQQRQLELAQEQAQLLNRTTVPPVHPPVAAHTAGIQLTQPLLRHDGKTKAPSPFPISIDQGGARNHLHPESNDLVSNMRGPPSSSSMTNDEWEQFRQTRGLDSASALIPLINPDVSTTRNKQRRPDLSLNLFDSITAPTRLTNSASTDAVSDQTTGAIANLHGLDSVLLINADAAVPNRLKTTLNPSNLNNLDELEQSVPNMDPVHGPNIQVRQSSISRSPDSTLAAGLEQRTLRNGESQTLRNERLRTPSIDDRPPSSGDSDFLAPYDSTAAVSTRAAAEMVNPESFKMTLESRNDFRSSLGRRIGALIGEELTNGRLRPFQELDVMVVAKLLAESVERHAYKNAADQESYRKNAEDTFNDLNKTDESLSKLIDGARHKLSSRFSRSRSATQTRQIPRSPRTPRHNGPAVSETIDTDPAEIAGAGSKDEKGDKGDKDDKDESVGVTVPSSLSRPPDLSIFQSLRHMMQRGANSKPGSQNRGKKNV
ncbi:hypothetical protein MMC26_002300 [Xylographa opegraphella]|nr:hypothetical protein [Xylographa opegraphella]